MPNGNDKPSEAKSMWRSVSPADLQAQDDQGGPTMGPDTRSLYRRVADWATRPTAEYGGTLDRPGLTPLDYGERGLMAAGMAAGAPEVGAATGALKLGKEALTRAPGALGGAAYGGRLASEVGLPKWSGQAIGGVGGFMAPEVLEKMGGPLLSRIARYLGKSAPEAATAAMAPEQLASKYGLEYRGEVSPGTGVHDFKAPDGGSLALREGELNAATVEKKLALRKQQIDPSQLSDVARSKGERRILSLQEAAQQGGTASAAGGAPAWESQAYTPEAKRLIQKLQQQGGRQ